MSEETMMNDDIDERTEATRAAIAHYGRWPEGEGAFVAGWMAHAAQCAPIDERKVPAS